MKKFILSALMVVCAAPTFALAQADSSSSSSPSNEQTMAPNQSSDQQSEFRPGWGRGYPGRVGRPGGGWGRGRWPGRVGRPGGGWGRGWPGRGGGWPGRGPRGPRWPGGRLAVTCHARDGRGFMYSASGVTIGDARVQAMRSCQIRSQVPCAFMGCN